MYYPPPHVSTTIQRIDHLAGMAMQGILASGRDPNDPMIPIEAHEVALRMVTTGIKVESEVNEKSPDLDKIRFDRDRKHWVRQ